VYIDEIKVKNSAHVILTFEPLTSRSLARRVALGIAQLVYLRLFLAFIQVLGQEFFEINMMMMILRCLLLPFYLKLLFHLAIFSALSGQTSPPYRTCWRTLDNH
jgi:hypothetical protein